MDLSADIINQKAPYNVRQIGTNSFLFETRFGLRYNVGFTLDQSFLEEGVYQFYIVNIDNSHFIPDPLIKETISRIISCFFDSEPATMLYICDTSDQRQGARDRLFRNWFSEYSEHENFTMVNECLCFDNINYYTSILLRNDHPGYFEIIKVFKEYISNLPHKIEEIQSL